MNTFKLICSIITTAFVLFSCKKNTVPEDNFDYEAQAVIDNDTLVKFLNNHYFNDEVDSIKPMVSGKTPLIDEVKTMDIEENDIQYKLYYYVDRVGTPDPDKESPTVMDSVLVKYYGQRIVNTDSISTSFDSSTIKPIWFILNGVIRGWSYGFTNFKGGKNISIPNAPINYENGGKGILFIPSGLAYGNNGSGAIGANESLIFYIDLYDNVVGTDHDNDGVASILEDPDGDGDPRNDDTDSDGIPNYLDPDDDNDGVPTIDEDANGDGNPANDFNGTNATLPDYLNPDVSS